MLQTIQLKDSVRINRNYRKVIWTAEQMQLVFMSLEGTEHIPFEYYEHAQFITVIEGSAFIIMRDEIVTLYEGDSFLIPKGIGHQVENNTKNPLKLHVIYSPPLYPDDTTQFAQPN